MEAPAEVMLDGRRSDEPNRDEVRFDPTDIDPGDVIGVRVNVDSASGTGGATVDVGARLVLIP